MDLCLQRLYIIITNKSILKLVTTSLKFYSCIFFKPIVFVYVHHNQLYQLHPQKQHKMFYFVSINTKCFLLYQSAQNVFFCYQSAWNVCINQHGMFVSISTECLYQSARNVCINQNGMFASISTECLYQSTLNVCINQHGMFAYLIVIQCHKICSQLKFICFDRTRASFFSTLFKLSNFVRIPFTVISLNNSAFVYLYVVTDS